MDEELISEFKQKDRQTDRQTDRFKQKEGFVVERRAVPSADWQRTVWLLCEELSVRCKIGRTDRNAVWGVWTRVCPRNQY